MLPACFQLADTVFPRVRAQAARNLVADGWSQNKAAEAVGVSQAMVSKYLARPVESDALVQRLAADVVAHASGDAGQGSWCTTLDGFEHDATRAALDDLLQAEQHLVAHPPMRVMPEIGLNLAVATPGARAPAQVLAYPARLVRSGDKLVRPSPPEMGGSNHLAQCLLEVQAGVPQVAAMANVLGTPDILAAAAKLGWSPRTLPLGNDIKSRFGAVADGDAKVFHDPGALGIEPCLYIAGQSARTVAQAITTLNEATT